MAESIQQACIQVFCSPTVWMVIVLSAVYGVFVGAIPGLTATMAVALFVPLAYWLEPIPALAAVVTMEACAIFAGDIPNTLLRIPGTPASAAYADDAYAFTRRGEPNRPLGVCLVFSVVGGLFGAAVLMIVGRQLASVATWFSVAEYFWLYLLGLSCAVVVSRGSTLHATLGLLLGLLFSTVGLSAVHAQARFTFGRPELFQGINFIPAMIGLFGVSEVLRNMLSLDQAPAGASAASPKGPAGGRLGLGRFIADSLVGVAGPALALLMRRKRHFLRSGAIGSLVGMLPGAGADIGAWVSLAASKRFSAKAETHEGGALEGIGDASASNSAALAATWIPALVFGIPGDSITAIVIGVLLMKNVRPGPEIFEKQPVLVYSIYLVFVLANLVLIPIGLAAIKLGGYVVRAPRRVLLPAILLFCVVGAYAINASYFDVWVMLGMGVLGFLLERWQIPLGPVVLGIILGGPLEERFIQTLTGSKGSLTAFVDRPISAVLAVVCIGLWVSALLWGRLRRAK
ncbi:MAG: tripartite tricarboxylate transporter permease [Candidatus Hydrogenedentes bacterium]|nr:tripartite tricarboxylate transporter permease [Candidatus Hydrogenedentota bacterium]